MNRLKLLRLKRGITQTKIQMLTGIDQSDYSKLENGKRYLTFEQCKRLALALQTSMDYLAGLTDEERPYPRSWIWKEGIALRPLKYKVSITLDSDLVEILKKLAERDDRSFSQYINMVLRSHVSRLQHKQQRR